MSCKETRPELNSLVIMERNTDGLHCTDSRVPWLCPCYRSPSLCYMSVLHLRWCPIGAFQISPLSVIILAAPLTSHDSFLLCVRPYVRIKSRLLTCITWSIRFGFPLRRRKAMREWNTFQYIYVTINTTSICFFSFPFFFPFALRSLPCCTMLVE